MKTTTTKTAAFTVVAQIKPTQVVDLRNCPNCGAHLTLVQKTAVEEEVLTPFNGLQRVARPVEFLSCDLCETILFF